MQQSFSQGRNIQVVDITCITNNMTSVPVLLSLHNLLIQILRVNELNKNN